MNERILVIGPHPDDESYYFGGAVAKYASLGADVRLLVLTNGEKGKIALSGGRNPEVRPIKTEEETWMADTRKKDCLKAAKKLGITHVEFAGLPDMGIDEKAIHVIYNSIVQDDPHVVLTFDETGTSYHPSKTDHSATGIAANMAVRKILLDVYGGNIFNQQSLPYAPPFSLRRLVTYVLPGVENRLENWGSVDLQPEDLINIDVKDHLWTQLRATIQHKTQKHLTNFFFRKSHVTDLNPVPFAERICIGQRAAGTHDILYGLDSYSGNLYLPNFPEAPDCYKSNSSGVIFEDIQKRSIRAEEYMYSLPSYHVLEAA